MGGGVEAQALEADMEVVAGTSRPVFWFAIYAMIAGKKISGSRLSSLVLSRTFTCQGIIIPEIREGLGSFNLWTLLMLLMQNITWMVIFFLAVS